MRRAAPPTVSQVTRRWLLLLSIAALVASPVNPARAATEDLEETDDLPTVQNRLFRTQHEFAAGVGILPIDPFYKGMTLTGGYAWHITDLWAVEGQYSYLLTFKTGLRKDLEENFAIPPTLFDELKWYAQAGALFKPLYGKLSLFNKSLVYGELYFSVHGVVGQMEGGRADDENPQGKGKRFAFGGAPGFGIRGYLNEYFSLRFDFRTMILASAGEVHVPLSLSLSVAVTTRTDL